MAMTYHPHFWMTSHTNVWLFVEGEPVRLPDCQANGVEWRDAAATACGHCGRELFGAYCARCGSAADRRLVPVPGVRVEFRGWLPRNWRLFSLGAGDKLAVTVTCCGPRDKYDKDAVVARFEVLEVLRRQVPRFVTLLPDEAGLVELSVVARCDAEFVVHGA
jgi:hypothetical protein